MVPSYEIARHKTAIRRPGFSLPIRCLLQDGLIDTTSSLFDYGCGRGHDIKLLLDLSISCTAWDPVHRPNGVREAADIVNLGYVINVIEAPRERSEVLREAWSFARKLLVVSAQLDTAAPTKAMPAFSDGILTSRDTFQKYYTQSELRTYLQDTLSIDVVPAAPGVFYAFRDDDAKQRFLAQRFRRTLSAPPLRVAEQVFEKNCDILQPFIHILTHLGRLPGPEEFEGYATLVERFGSAKRALAIVRRATGTEAWKNISAQRAEDLLVYLALSRFERRPTFSQLPIPTQRDTKAFFGTYQRACQEADTLLFKMGDTATIDAACCRSQVGLLVDNALIFHRNLLPDVEPLLRIYEGCARALVGEIEEANVIKLHRFSGKVTYLTYPDFDIELHPRLASRVKVTLPSQAIHFFDHSKDTSGSVLEDKSALLRQS